MASTAFASGDPQTAKRWARKCEVQIVPNTILGTLGGKSSMNAFKVVDDLTKGAGDRIRNYWLRHLSDEEGLPLEAAAGGDESPEGQEKSQIFPTYDVEIDMTSQAVRFKKYMTEQRLPFEIRSKAREGLVNWWIDVLDIAFLAHAAGYTPYNATRFKDLAFNNTIVDADADHKLYADEAAAHTTDQGVGGDATSILTKNDVDRMILLAESQHEMGNYAIAKAQCLGNEHWVLIISTRQHHDLKQDPDWQRQVEEISVQGGEVDKGNLTRYRYKNRNLRLVAYYNDVAVFVSHRAPRGVDSGTGARVLNTRRAVLMGGCAVTAAFGRETPGPERYVWNEWKFPYGRELGVDSGLIGGMVKTRLDINGATKDLATIVLTSYAQEAP